MARKLSFAQEKLLAWRLHPDLMVRELFHVEPDTFQEEALVAFPTSKRLAIKGCAGPGKTAVLAWLILNFLLTRPHPAIGATSITKDNLRDNLWSECARWIQKTPVLDQQFEWQAERIVHRKFPATWWASAKAWNRSAKAEDQGKTMAGLHSDYVMAVLDESGGIPRAVMAAADAVLAGDTEEGQEEAHILQAGNPIVRHGPLWDACTTERGLWKVIDINADPDNPLRARRVSRQWAREFIAKYGADHPWVQAKIFSRFPKGTELDLIPMDRFEDAFGREATGLVRGPKTVGIDVARGGEDETVVTLRDGDFLLDQITWGTQDLVDQAGLCREIIDPFEPESIRVDDIGVGGGLTDNLGKCRYPSGKKYNVIGVNTGAGSPDPRYLNLRAYLNVKIMREDRFRANQISINPKLKDTPLMPQGISIRREYSGHGEKVKVESKEEYKARTEGNKSPDHWDSAVLAYAVLDQVPATGKDNALAWLERQQQRKQMEARGA